jgi:Cd2+/Zn2+-exporting ATPase
VPLTYFSGIGASAKNGVLVKGATYLDVLAKVNAVAFDKTGTLTKGIFSVQAVYPQDGVDKNELLSIAAALEKNSSHPIAKAFLSVKSDYICENVIEHAGKGLSGEIGGEKVFIGKKALLVENFIQCDVDGVDYTRVYVAKGERFLGTIEIGDETREETKGMVAELKKLGIQKTVMLTGDIESTARKIAAAVGISEVYYGLLPDEKLRRAEEIKKENRLAYIGDGINDAPVMTVADVAVSMGTLGSAAAVETSDLVLISDDLRGFVKAVKISQKTNKIVKQNVVFSLLMKIAFMALGIIGILPLWLAVFADVGVMLLAVLNSLRMRLKIKD